MRETKAGETELEGKTARELKSEKRESWVEVYRTSAQTQAEFAKENGINLATLQGWIYKRRAVNHGRPGRIAPVRIVGCSHPSRPHRQRTFSGRRPRRCHRGSLS